MTLSTTEHITLLSPNISCGHCVGTVQNAVGKLDGVAEVSASAETKFVEVSFDPERTSVDEITAALAQAGYPAQQ